MNTNIIYENDNLNNLSVVIRYPTSNDASDMCEYINALSKEKTYITYQGEKISLENEQKYLDGQLEKIKNHESIQLLLYLNNKLSGITSIDMGSRVEKHIGVFGVSISKQFRGIGFGKMLTKFAIQEAINNLRKLKIIILEAMAINTKAIKIYLDFGFKEYGVLKNGNLYKGKLVDVVLMSKNI